MTKNNDWQSIVETPKRPKKQRQYEKNGFNISQKRALRRGYNAKFKTEDKIKITYKPLNSQREFAKLIEDGKRIVLYIGGRQGGKTYAGARESIKQIYKYCRKPNLGWIISPTYPMSLVVERAFEEAAGFAENGGLIIKKFRGDRAYLLYPPKGSSEPFRVEIKTAENPDRLRGAAVSWIWMDEAAMMSEDTYKILLGCILATKGVIFMTTTPRGLNWVSEVAKESEKNQLFGFVKSRSRNNTYLDSETLKILEGQYSDDFARQELDAEFVSFEGLVYKAFSQRHVIPSLLQVPSGSEVIGGVDNGYGDPFVHLWIVKNNGNYYVVDEYYEPGRPIDAVARSIKASRWDKSVIRRWADPSGAQERCDLDRWGIATYPARNEIQSGINEVARIIEQGKLYITQNCVHTIKEIFQYHYPSRNGRNSGEKPVDCNNHAMDALRYAIASESLFSQSHPYIETDDHGVMHVRGRETDNLMSNRLEEWLNLPSYELGEIRDADLYV